MSRRPIQVPVEVFEEMTEYRTVLYARSHHELITRLMQEHREHVKLQEKMENEFNAEKQRQENEMLQLGEELKNEFDELRQDLNLNYDKSLVKFLIEHYKNSLDINSMTFMYYRDLVKEDQKEWEENRWRRVQR